MMKVPKKRNYRASMDFDNDLANNFQPRSLLQAQNHGRNTKPKNIKSAIIFKDITLE